ncbi:MAG: fumarylacetoacetate hydrolase family protein [Actinomycetota bacterium]|nr:fumarylacetoacetate hydrolase family protein [Actinomycetota bacterium]
METSDDRRWARAAARIVAARLSDDDVLDALPELDRPTDETEGYAVQALVHRILSAAGMGTRSGWKIGCTTAVMQEYLGISSPCAGGMFRESSWRNSHRFPRATRGRVGVECELAVRLAIDVVPVGGEVGVHDAARAVATCMAAIEVVEDRYRDFRRLGVPTLVADDFFHHGCVLGAERSDVGAAELRASTAELRVNGAVVGSGSGKDILGEPMRALAWLANSAASWGTPLRAGEVVLLGSIVPTRWVSEGDVASVVNLPLGKVSAEF